MTTRLNKVLKKHLWLSGTYLTPVQKEMNTTQSTKMSCNVIIRIVNCIAYALSLKHVNVLSSKYKVSSIYKFTNKKPSAGGWTDRIQGRWSDERTCESSGSFQSARRIGNNCKGELFLRQGRSRASLNWTCFHNGDKSSSCVDKLSLFHRYKNKSNKENESTAFPLPIGKFSTAELRSFFRVPAAYYVKWLRTNKNGCFFKSIHTRLCEE